MKHVLVTGGNFLNQGAYLMLVAAGDGVRQRLGAQPVIPIRFGTQRQKSWIGYDTLLAEERFGFFPRLGKGGDGSWRDRLPFVTASDIDAVLDITGFAFGDQWADAPLMRRAKNYEMWQARGVPVYMLPQAFGPFNQTAQPAELAVRSSRIVHARDRDSYSYLESLLSAGDASKLRLSPDFTLGVPGTEPSRHSNLDDFSVIVPNWNIFKRGTSEQASSYISCLNEFAGALQRGGTTVVGVCHEGRGDKQILEEVRKNFPGMEIVDGLDGQELKWLLGRAKVVVSGRYHALVSALAQGVPSVLHGWSHKYKWLAEDFDCVDMIGDPYAGRQEVDQLVARATAEEGLRQRISVAAESVKKRNDEMWNEIRTDLKW